MREKDFVLLAAIGMLLLLAPLAEAQVYPLGAFAEHGAVVQSGPVAQVTAANGCSSCASRHTPNYQSIVAQNFSSGGCNGCAPTAATVPGDLPTLPVSSCCGKTGRLHIPPLLTTPLRYDTPPIGRSVGRPLFGRWPGL